MIIRSHVRVLLIQLLVMERFSQDVIAVSSADENALALVDASRGLRNMPRLFQRGFYDGNVYKQYLIVHDNCSDPALLQR